MKKQIKIIIITCIIITFLNFSVTGVELNSELQVPKNYLQNLTTITIVDIIDGNTFKTKDNDIMQMEAIDTPELNENYQPLEYYGVESYRFTQGKLNSSATIYVETTSNSRGYIFLEDGTLLNALLLKKGMAELQKQDKLKFNKMRTIYELAKTFNRGIHAPLAQAQGKFPHIQWHQADQYIGKKVKVEGRVKKVYQSPLTNRILLNFKENDWKEDLTIIIPSNLLDQFSRDLRKLYHNQTILVKGIIEKYRGSLEIQLKNSKLISIKR